MERKPEKYDGENMDTACRVPSEIWVKIMAQLNQKELVRARTVCSIWRNVVDEHFQFSVIVHDDKTDLDRVYRIRIKDCLITKLLDSVDILQHPDLLRRVRFWGPINILNIQRIMLQATKLEELSMTRCALTQKDLFPKVNPLVLEKLMKLELLGYCCKDAGEEVANNVLHLLNHEMPRLQKIFVNITCYWKQMDPIVAAFFDFLARHRNKITHVNASLIPAAGGHEAISHLPTAIPQKTKDLIYDQELQLESLRLTIANKYIPCWAPIISSQKKLIDIRVHWSTSSEPPNPNFTGISSAILYPAIMQSAVNLVSVDLRDLNLTIDESRAVIPFDASIFRFSKNLRRLALVRNKDDCQRHSELYGASSMINLDEISSALEDLEIVRFKCRSYELQTLIDRSESLKNVKLQHTGTASGKGVHGGIVDSITKKIGIKIINSFPINYYDPEENKKLEDLKSIYDGICSGSDHIYFDFDRFRQGIPQPSKKNSLPLAPQEYFASTSQSISSLSLSRLDCIERRSSNYNLRIRSRLTWAAMQDHNNLRVSSNRRLCIRSSHAHASYSRLSARSLSAGPSDRDHHRTSPLPVPHNCVYQAMPQARNLRPRQRRSLSAENIFKMRD